MLAFGRTASQKKQKPHLSRFSPGIFVIYGYFVVWQEPALSRKQKLGKTTLDAFNVTVLIGPGTNHKFSSAYVKCKNPLRISLRMIAGKMRRLLPPNYKRQDGAFVISFQNCSFDRSVFASFFLERHWDFVSAVWTEFLFTGD